MYGSEWKLRITKICKCLPRNGTVFKAWGVLSRTHPLFARVRLCFGKNVETAYAGDECGLSLSRGGQLCFFVAVMENCWLIV